MCKTQSGIAQEYCSYLLSGDNWQWHTAWAMGIMGNESDQTFLHQNVPGWSIFLLAGLCYEQRDPLAPSWAPNKTSNGPCEDNWRGPLLKMVPQSTLHGMLSYFLIKTLGNRFPTWFEVNLTFVSRNVSFLIPLPPASLELILWLNTL